VGAAMLGLFSARVSELTVSETRLALICWFLAGIFSTFFVEPLWVITLASLAYGRVRQKLSNCIANLRVRLLILRRGKEGLNKAMRKAGRQGNLVYLQRLIKHGGSDLDGALREAAKEGEFAMVEWLVEQGASATDVNTALLNAASSGHMSIVEHLVVHGGQTTNSHTLETALQMAAGHGHLEVVEWFVQTEHATGLQQALEAARQYEQGEVAEWLYARIAERIANAYFADS